MLNKLSKLILLSIGALFILSGCAKDTILESGILPVDDTWKRDEKRNLLYNFTNMYQPDVIYDNEEKSQYKFKMWFFGWAAGDSNPNYPGSDAIFHARSKDMKKWEVYCGNGQWDNTMNPEKWVPVVYASDEFYDNWHNGDPSVVKKDGKYYMAYSALGTDKEGILQKKKGDTDGNIMCIMGAVSDDGINWVKTSEPILIWKEEIGVDENPGRSDGTHLGDYHRPSLMWDEDRWKLWFDYWSGPANGISMGDAENSVAFEDTGSWEVIRASDNPLLKQWPNPDVVKIGSLYYSYADPIVVLHKADPEVANWTGWQARQLAEAVSDDGINWTVTGWIMPDPDAVANHVPQAFVHKNTIYLFYATQIGGEPYNF